MLVDVCHNENLAIGIVADPLSSLNWERACSIIIPNEIGLLAYYLYDPSCSVFGLVLLRMRRKPQNLGIIPFFSRFLSVRDNVVVVRT